MKRKKVLIVYATAGIGHKKAALAVKKAFDELNPAEAEASMIDALDYTNAFFKWIYLKVYLLMVNRLPLLWGALYYFTDNPLINFIVAPMRRMNNHLNSGKFRKFLTQMKPDVVICTHFFATEVIADMKEKGALKTHLITVVTDYKLHAWWIEDGVDTYVVGGDDAGNDLLRWKVPAEKIKVLGIPVEPVFSKALDREKALKAAGLKEGVFTVLVIGGGFGVGPIEEIVKAIGSVSKPVQAIAICGHNEHLARRLEELKKRFSATVKVLGFVDNVYDYMEVSDILISKSGGITVSESLAKELPMIVIAPIIGQETRNSDYLASNRAALKLDKAEDLKGVLEGLASDPSKAEALKEAVRRIRKPRACYDVARLAIDFCAGN